MNSLTNSVQVIGHLGRDPEVKTTATGKKIARFSVAANEAYRNEEGKRIETTQWISLVAWEGLATIAEKYLHKGKQVAVCGRLVTRQYTDTKGEKKWITEVVAQDILLLGAPLREESFGQKDA
ncbi:MAG TPA: single-stranded DNA-binding protein [Bacteroidia bacterium]|nr:single-stranded DNA-binding protein [Bacteroidia bacterium]